MNLTIKEVIDNMTDELNRASEMIDVMAHGGVYTDDSIDEVLFDINRTILDDLDYLKERIDIALLMSATIGDVSISTCDEIYKAEAEFRIPFKNDEIDTEEIYNSLDNAVRNIDID